MFVKIGEYNSKPSLQLLRHEDDEYAVVIGGASKYTSMVVAMVENAEDVLKFIEKNNSEKGKDAALRFRAKFGLETPKNGEAKKVKKPKVTAEAE